MTRWWRRRRATPSCGEIMDVLQSYLDGEVDSETARSVAVHLDMCPACGPEAEVYRRIKASLKLHAEPVDPVVLANLEQFGRRLARGDAGA